MDLEAYELVILRRPADAPDDDEESLREIQEVHVAYHGALRDAGQVVTNGPVDGQADELFRGVTVYRTGSIEAARVLAETDPAVKAGRLEVEVMTWYCPPGTMRLPGAPVQDD
jgi:uncharacterized protein YciI